MSILISLLNYIRQLFSSKPQLYPGAERPSPNNWLPSEAIRIDGNKFIIDCRKVLVSGLEQAPILFPIHEIPNSNSMDGFFDAGNNNLLISGANSRDHEKLVKHLIPGDIAVYQFYPERYDVGYAIHRIRDIEEDGVGTYYTFMGDNNAGIADPYKIRPHMIKYIWIGMVA